MDPFVHLHVASGYSRQYGASHPHALVERAAEHEMDTLALTDRDGTYGAVRHAKACRAAGLRPVLGVDLAVRPCFPLVEERASRNRPRTPVRGGAFRDDRLIPRVTFLADASHAGGRAGWAAVCRLVSAVQLAGERGAPGADLAMLTPRLESGGGGGLLGPAPQGGGAPARPPRGPPPPPPGPRRGGGRRGPPPRRPRPRRPGAVARGGPRGEPLRRAGLPPVAPDRRQRLGTGHDPPRRADGGVRPQRRARHGAVQCRALRRPPRRP